MLTGTRDAISHEDAPSLFFLEHHGPGTLWDLAPPQGSSPLAHLSLLQKTTHLPPKTIQQPEEEAAEHGMGLTLPWSCCVSLT